MGQTTGISWADSTFNPWLGCVEVSPACDHCYARTLVTGRMGKGLWGKEAPRARTSDAYWTQPKRWNKIACEAGKRHTVFCGSLCDVMEDRADLVPIRRDLYELIGETLGLTWLLLSKRPQNFRRFLPPSIPPNIWALTTVESPRELWRIDYLKASGVHTLGLSIEPLLEDIPTIGEYLDGISWVLVGGESGAAASRPMHPDWARRIRDECVSRGIAFHYKQTGDWTPEGGSRPGLQSIRLTINGRNGSDLANASDGGDTWMHRIGKKAAGHLLDGVEWLQFPEPTR